MFAIVIPTRNVENLSACVRAIRKHEVDSAIIVVDDDESGKIRKHCESEDLIRVPGQKPFVFARNCNAGIRQAFGLGFDAVVLMNDDALLQTQCGFTQLAYVAATDVSLGLLSPATNNVGNENQNFRGYKRLRYDDTTLCFVCIFIPKTTWQLVGELDEDFVNYGFEDSLYSEKVKRAGLRLGIWDPCQVDHASLHPTFRSMPNHHQSFLANQEIYREKLKHL
jgi:GT2 family glycosyltransferase